MASHITQYVVLLRAFVDGRLSADEFDGIFLWMFQRHDSPLSEDEYRVLNGLFADADAYWELADTVSDDHLGARRRSDKCGRV